MVTIPGSEILTSGLNMISQSLQIPVIIFLILFAIFAVITLGGLISEYTSRRKISVESIEKIIYSISNAESYEEILSIVKNAKIYESQKVILIKVLRAHSLPEEARHTLAKKLIEAEESKFGKKLEKTDIVTKIGPTLGLMGTLIPMGPGLAALGVGDVNTLANAIIVAFDTTVVGIGSGAVAYFVSKIRRGWYEEYLSDLDALIDVILVRLKD